MKENAPGRTASPTLSDWARLGWADVLAVVITLATVAAVVIPRLPPGICFDDGGELQLAATTLGITHAPGYPVFASLGYLATLVPGVDPAHMVSLAALGTGLVAIVFCILLQRQLGVTIGVACAVALVFVAHPRTWINLIGPEVYAPTLMFQTSSAYLLVRFARLGRRRDLWISAFLFGVALANRPPVLLSLPFMLAAWWMAERRWEPSGSRRWRSLGILAACALLPTAYALGYLYVRDTPSTPYNYIELHDIELNQVPDSDQGVLAKLHRVFWHASAREFTYAMGNNLTGVWSKLVWFRREFFLYEPHNFVIALILLGAGMVVARRRCPITLTLLLGMIVSSLIFICSYRMWGQAADYQPLLWAVMVLLGVSTTAVIPAGRRFSAPIGMTALLAMVAFTLFDAKERPQNTLSPDATVFVAEMDMATLPPNAVVCVAWPETPAVFYAQHIVSRRDDIHIVAATTANWARLLERFQDRPMFGASTNNELVGYDQTPFRNLWRLTRQSERQ